MQNEFGSYLRSVRNKRGRTLKQVAIAMGKSTGYICDIELGRRGTARMDPMFIHRLADYLNFPANELLVRAGLVDRKLDAQYGDYYKIMRSKVRAMRVGELIAAAKSDIIALKSETNGVKNGMSEILFSLENHILELDSTLTHG
jgi:transcriptional regulator with XRE-family HTH domain